MQPYFVPYAGYFRLFAASDVFVIYDCVQFPRRGWVHRNRFADAPGREQWLTLPLAKAPRDVLIRDLRFQPDAAAVFEERVRRVPVLSATRGHCSDVISVLLSLSGTPVDYLERLLSAVNAHLGFRPEVLRSSTMHIPETLRGQERILEIARRLRAARYVNAPGGRALYDADRFEQAGIELRFLDEYGGPSVSILQRLLTEDVQSLADDIRRSAISTSTTAAGRSVTS